MGGGGWHGVNWGHGTVKERLGVADHVVSAAVVPTVQLYHHVIDHWAVPEIRAGRL